MAYTKTYAARTDSASANNPALNLTGDPAQEITFVNVAPDGSPGDLILEAPAGGGVDPDTQVMIGGSLYSFTFDLTGTLPTTARTGARQVPDQYEGSTVNVIVVEDYPAPGDTTRFAFLPDEQATLADMDAFGNGAISVQSVNYSPPPAPVCFGEGTLIAAATGLVRVETLRAGDRVRSLCGALREVLWVSASAHRWNPAPHRHKPVLIAAHALGPGRPWRDLVVSPQHRMRVALPDPSGRHRDVLAPAIGLTHLEGIRQMRGCRAMRYHHVLLDVHSVVEANGAAGESLYPGPMALRMLDPAQRRGLLSALAGRGAGALALPALTRAESRRCVAPGAGALVSAA